MDEPRGLLVFTIETILRRADQAFDRVVGLPRYDLALRGDLVDTMMLRPLGVVTASLGILLMSLAACWYARADWAFVWFCADVVVLTARVIPAWIAWRNGVRVPDRIARIIMVSAAVMFTTFGLGCAASFATGIEILRLAATMAIMGLFTGLAIRWAALPRLSIGMHVIVSVPMLYVLTGISGFVTLLFVVLAIGSMVLTIQNNRTLRALLSAKRQAQRLAHTDVLTQLRNRAGLQAELDRLAAAEREGDAVSLLFLDLDGFKAVNDRHGHAAGDRLLVEIGARLRAIAGEAPVARLGGDEFVVVLSGAAAQNAEAVAAAARDAITRPIALREQGALVSVGVSLGGATGPLRDGGAARLLAEADTALYAVKRRRRAPHHAPSAPRRSAAQTAVA